MARVDESGRIFAVRDGQCVLTATVAGQIVKANVRIEGSGVKRPFSFARDIGSVLTKRGCNSSGCHGGVKGQAGFKLSVTALYPKEDYKWIVEGGTFQVLTSESSGPKNPRINLKEPEQSLLLLKPTMAIPHGGGLRFEASSDDYQMILNWIRNGALYGEESDAGGSQVVQLEVFPTQTILRPGDKHRLLVTAHLASGKQEDYTDQVSYLPGDPKVISVGSDGEVEAKKPGETAIMVRAVGQAISASFGVIGKPVVNYPVVSRKNFIDDEIFSKLRMFNVIPSELSSDGEFLRRVCFDLTGTLPPPSRVREFLAGKDPRKRETLAETLLNTPEYVDYWTFRFADLFRVSFNANGFNAKWSQAYWEWIREWVSQNKPYDQVARERIAAQGYNGPSRHFVPFSVLPIPSDSMAEQVRVFMGRRMDCAQCHDHPYESWSQNQFWGLTAFFGQVHYLGNQIVDSVVFDILPGSENVLGDTAVGKSMKVIHPRTRQEVRPAFLDGKVLPDSVRVNPRMEFAKWVTSHPYFAEAAVNRMWSYFFGRGIVDPVDDFRSTNPPTHPDLLNLLAQDFREHGHDLKRLMRLIVNSSAYQLSSKPNETNKEDRINYSRALPRPLDAEVLLDAISDVVGVPEVFTISASSSAGGRAPLGTRAINLKEPDLYYSRFLELYGRPLRQAVPERRGKASLGQAFHMLAGTVYVDKLLVEGGRLHRLIKSGASDGEIIEAFYLAALARFPTKEEFSRLHDLTKESPNRPEALQNLVWALVSSREFAENH